MQRLCEVILLRAAPASLERRGEAGAGLHGGSEREQIARIQWVRTLDQKVVDSAFTDFSLTLDQSDLRDFLRISQPWQEVAGMGVDGVPFAIIRSQFKYRCWRDAARGENAGHGDLQGRCQSVVRSVFEATSQSEHTLVHIELAGRILVDEGREAEALRVVYESKLRRQLDSQVAVLEDLVAKCKDERHSILRIGRTQ